MSKELYRPGAFLKAPYCLNLILKYERKWIPIRVIYKPEYILYIPWISPRWTSGPRSVGGPKDPKMSPDGDTPLPVSGRIKLFLKDTTVSGKIELFPNLPNLDLNPSKSRKFAQFGLEPVKIPKICPIDQHGGQNPEKMPYIYIYIYSYMNIFLYFILDPLGPWAWARAHGPMGPSVS